MLLPQGKRVPGVAELGQEMPALFARLQAEAFSGYLRLGRDEEQGVLLFARGRLKGAFYADPQARRSCGLAAVRRVYDMCERRTRCTLYQTSLSLVHLLDMVLRGRLVQRISVTLMHPEEVYTWARVEHLTGVLHIYAADETRAVLIFFRNGEPVGFFHDGEEDLVASADPASSVVCVPGSCLDVISFVDGQSDEGHFAEAFDPLVLWEMMAVDSRRDTAIRARIEDLDPALVNNLRQLAVQHIGEIGYYLVDQELPRIANTQGEILVEERSRFLHEIGRVARMVSASAAVKAMLARMDQVLENQEAEA